MQKENLPIGYWIKEADELLTKGIDKIQSKFGLSRSDWQMLNLIAERPSVERKALVSTMEPFISALEVNHHLAKLESDGLVSRTDDCLSLTATGKTRHAECLKIQKEFRQKAMRNISDETYESTIATLKQIVDNLK